MSSASNPFSLIESSVDGAATLSGRYATLKEAVAAARAHAERTVKNGSPYFVAVSVFAWGREFDRIGRQAVRP